MTNDAAELINKLVAELSYGRSAQSIGYYFENYSDILIDERALSIRIGLEYNTEYSLNSLQALSTSIINKLSNRDIKISFIDDSAHLFVDVDSGYSNTDVFIWIKLKFNIDEWALFNNILERKAVEDAERLENEKQERKRKRKEKADQKKKKEQEERLLLEKLIKKYGNPNNSGN
jgi:hypothetical protein